MPEKKLGDSAFVVWDFDVEIEEGPPEDYGGEVIVCTGDTRVSIVQE